MEDTKKAQIIALKNYFGTAEHYDNDLIADAVGCSESYAKKFGRDDAGEVVNVEAARRGGRVPTSRKRAVRERDEFACVRCAATSSEASLEVHHVIPAANGGGHDMENLAMLCKECHAAAHGAHGRGTSETVYESRDEFWNEWIVESPSDNA